VEDALSRRVVTHALLARLNGENHIRGPAVIPHRWEVPVALVAPTLSLTPDLSSQVADLQSRLAALETVIQIPSAGNVLIQAANSIVISARAFQVNTDTTLTLTAGTNFSLKATGSATLLSNTTMTIKGSILNLN
jgi:hypothetical protein